MIPYNQKPIKYIELENCKIASFIYDKKNVDRATRTVNSFGNEWNKFSNFSEQELVEISQEYFDIVNDSVLNKNSYIIDLGGGSGRWAKCIANKVKFIELIEPSHAIFAAYKVLQGIKNVRITQAEANNIPFSEESFDFGMCLGVLHHIPNTEQALRQLVKTIKLNGYILLYLYYKFDNRGLAFKTVFRISNLFRIIISSLPNKIKKILCDIIACTIYLPFIIFAKLIKILIKGNFYKKIPLSYYIDKSFYIIRNDALDRFGTPIEKRFTKVEIQKMLKNAGLDDIVFSNNAPYWHCIAKRVY